MTGTPAVPPHLLDRPGTIGQCSPDEDGGSQEVVGDDGFTGANGHTVSGVETHKSVPAPITPMANVTVTVPDEFKERMEDHPEINWSQVARQAFEEKISDLEALEKLKDLEVIDDIASRSELTEADVEEIAKSVDRALADDFLDERA